MNANEVLRIIDAIHRDKNIDKEIIFQAIESALASALKKHYGEEAVVIVNIDRKDGSISGTADGVPLDPEETSGRIGAQTAKQVIIQKVREAAKAAGLPVFGGENAPYVWVGCPTGLTSWDMFDKMLGEAQVVITPGSGFGSAGEG